jgi:thiol-disulfide isomerase/thioredoxin
MRLRFLLQFVAERRWKAALKVQEEGWKDEDGTTINGVVHHLITDDFVAQTEKTEKMVVMFYAPWCAHCTTFKPIFANASTTLKETLPDVGFASVDCETNPDLCRKYLADSYPTVKYFDFSDKKDKGKLFSRGQRGEKQLLMWVDVMHKVSSINRFNSQLRSLLSIIAFLDCKALTSLFTLSLFICLLGWRVERHQRHRR